VKARLKGTKIFDFKGLRPRDGDVLIIKKWPGFTREDHELIIEALNQNIKANIITLFANSLSDVKLLSERQLNAVGLQRIKNPGTHVPEFTHTKKD
jgi:hypothetical protein